MADIAENTAGIWELHERALVTKPVPNFTRLDPSRPDIAILMNAMLRAREVAAARLMSLTILVSCSKCPWQAAFSRAELLSNYGPEYPMPNLLDHLAMPGCSKIKSQWDRCGVYYVNPIDGRER